jgi:hypothetical protein
MDRVRFGRALGIGTREAARALLKAADAATAPNPNPPARPVARVSQPQPTAPRTPVQTAAQTVTQTSQKIRTTQAGVKVGAKRFGEAVWRPVTKLSGVLWLEVTGVLFSLFVIAAAVALWSHRADLRAAGAPRQHYFAALAMLVLFGYLTISSFVRANRRSRR